MKKIITRLIVFLLIILAVPVLDVQAAGNNKKACKAYRSWLNKKAPSKYKEFALVKLDKDSVPELVGHYQKNGMDHYVICGYDGRKVVTKRLSDGVAPVGGYRGVWMYMPKKGKLLHEYIYGGTGSECDEVYHFKKGKLKLVTTGSKEYQCGKKICAWGGKKTGKGNYERKLKKAFNTSKGKVFYDLKYISRTKMKKKLR